jgi:hypothetical protein
MLPNIVLTGPVQGMSCPSLSTTNSTFFPQASVGLLENRKARTALGLSAGHDGMAPSCPPQPPQEGSDATAILPVASGGTGVNLDTFCSYYAGTYGQAAVYPGFASILYPQTPSFMAAPNYIFDPATPLPFPLTVANGGAIDVAGYTPLAPTATFIPSGLLASNGFILGASVSLATGQTGKIVFTVNTNGVGGTSLVAPNS